MSRLSRLSPAAIKAMFSSETDEQLIMLLTVYDPNGSTDPEWQLLTHTAARSLILSNAKLNQIPDTGGGTTDSYSLQGSTNRYLSLISTLYPNSNTAGNLIPWSRTSQNWSKAFTLSNLDRNWGLYRCWYGANPDTNWGSSPDTANNNLSGTVSVAASGKNVDIVIVDGVIDPNHPEFAVNSDGTGGSRVKYFNWYSLNIPGDPAANNTYSPPITTTASDASDDSRHAVHVASIAAGNTQGWAPNANIYNISPQYVTGGVQYTYLYKYILYWHNQKVASGNTNPTIVNNSWYSRYTILYTNITSITYRGSVVAGPFTINQLAAYGIMVIDSGTYAGYCRIGLTNSVMDADIQACIDAGIIMVACAGNDGTKITTDPTDIDYNNTVTAPAHNPNAMYYSRGSSPGATSNVICVGNISSSVESPGADRKHSTSNCGPRVDLYAPGTLITSAWLTNTGNTGINPAPIPDPRNSSYYMAKNGGTSMAAPQVTGILACALEKAMPIRLSDNYTQRLSTTTDNEVVYGVVSNSLEYMFIPMTLNLPNEQDTGLGDCTITLNFVTPEIITIIRDHLRIRTKVLIELVVSSNLNYIEASLQDYYITSATYNAETVTLNLGMVSYNTEPFPAFSFTPSYFPGLF